MHAMLIRQSVLFLSLWCSDFALQFWASLGKKKKEGGRLEAPLDSRSRGCKLIILDGIFDWTHSV